jgi:hypothetical protein
MSFRKGVELGAAKSAQYRIAHGHDRRRARQSVSQIEPSRRRNGVLVTPDRIGSFQLPPRDSSASARRPARPTNCPGVLVVVGPPQRKKGTAL